MTFQELVLALQAYWSRQGCILQQPYDMEMGAGTFHPATFLRVLGPEPWNVAYVQPSRRPTDGRYGDNPNRLQHYYQFQVILKPSPLDIQEQYLGSLRAIGIDPEQHDIRFVEDDWESPTLGAWGLGWEVWLDGMEVTQFTYFQQVGGLELKPVSGEITYGLERLAMYIQGVESVFDVVWTDGVTYGDVFHRNEVDYSRYNFEAADVDVLFGTFARCEQEAVRLVQAGLPLPGYDQVIKSSHAFNLLDARGAISVTERANYIGRVRALARQTAEAWLAQREALGFPLLRAASHPEAVAVPVVSSVAQDGQGNGELLLEIGCEEIPARMLAEAIATLRNGLTAALDSARIAYDSVESHGTPRRLAACVTGLAPRQTASHEERRGPPVERAFDAQGAPTPAALGFARSCGVTMAELERMDTPKGSYLVWREQRAGAASASVLPALVVDLVRTFPWPKSMRWGGGDSRFVRPVQRLTVVLDGQVLPLVTPEGICAGDQVQGHRFLAPALRTVRSWREYRTALADNKVVLEFAERCRLIEEGVTRCAREVGGTAVIEQKLLEENAALVEWPVALRGGFAAHHLEIPPEVLTTSMKNHQKYFPVTDSDGRLMPWFVVIANSEADPAVLVQGFERVLRARLADAAFYWQDDRRVDLRQRLETLERVVFQARLGSMAEKSRRIAALARRIAEQFDPACAALAATAGLYAKCDLVTGMVGEFPELQGIMGGYYYLASTDDDRQVAQAIREHYQPQGAGDSLPASALGSMLSLADKLDTLTGYFGLDMAPTGAKDPFALRRAALGVLRILLAVAERGWHLPLRPLLEAAHGLYADGVLSRDAAQTTDAIMAFFYGRLSAWLRADGVEYDTMESVQQLAIDRMDDVVARVRALEQFRTHADCASLVAANKRIVNLLEKSAGRTGSDETDGMVAGAEVRGEHLQEPAERELFQALGAVRPSVAVAVQQGDYARALATLASLRTPVDRFFAGILVMDERAEIRQNRLALLRDLRHSFNTVADISRLVLSE